MSSSKKRGAQKRSSATEKKNLGRWGRLAAKHSLEASSEEERALMDRGLRILARMLARAHLERHGLLVTRMKDSPHEVTNGSIEEASTSYHGT